MKKLGFIGVGNMGGALLRGCARTVDGCDIVISDFDEKKTAYYAETLGCAVADSGEVAATAEYVFIGVKPQAAERAFETIRPALAERLTAPVIVSMMAGVTIERIRELCGCDCPVIRIMPNVAASVGEAMILCASVGVRGDMMAEFAVIMKEAGKLDVLPESMIDAATAVSGCGPAYVCLFAEALADGAVKCGVPRQKAMDYAIQTLLGTAKLLAESGKHPAVVKDEVTSPGGSTIEGVEALEKNGFRYGVMEAVTAAYEKNLKLK